MRVRIEKKIAGGGNYFSAPKLHRQFISSGCKTLDLALGGGWAEDRIANIVGDKSTGKTLLCIESCANFAAKYPKGKIRYREAEAAFDIPYAGALGMPVDRVDFGEPMETVEDLFEDMQSVIAKATQNELYICDSLDSLSDRSELARDMDEGTYGAQKAKNLSQLFRRLVRKLEAKHITVLIVSQVRDKIGISFGRKTSRSGGKALDFYASQVLYLAHLGTLAKIVSGTKRPTGVKVKAKVDKNKVGLSFRESEFSIKFGYGIDDLKACADWLKLTGNLRDVMQSKGDVGDYIAEVNACNDAEFKAEMKRLHVAVEKRWWEIEQSLMPTRKKY